jgi:hypothetical protein
VPGAQHERKQRQRDGAPDLHVTLATDRRQQLVEMVDELRALGDGDVVAIQLVDEILDLLGEAVDVADFRREADGAQDAEAQPVVAVEHELRRGRVGRFGDAGRGERAARAAGRGDRGAEKDTLQGTTSLRRRMGCAPDPAKRQPRSKLDAARERGRIFVAAFTLCAWNVRITGAPDGRPHRFERARARYT